MQSAFIMTRSIRDYGYLSPANLEEAIGLLEKYGKKAVVLAGGTDLLINLKTRAVAPEYVINIKTLPGLNTIEETGEGGVTIGALVTMSQIKGSEIVKRRFRSLYQTTTEAYHSWQIRNLATIGGNICNSSPAADSVPPLMTYDAEVKLAGPKGERGVRLEEFVTGAGQNVLNKEILTKIVIPPQQGRYGTAFHGIKRTSVDLCKLNCAVRVVLDQGRFNDIRIAVGAVAPTAVRAKKAEEALRGKAASEDNIQAAARKVIEDISPITDARSTAEYRRQVSQVVVTRLLQKSVEFATSV